MDTNEPSGKSGDETAKAEPEKKTDVLTLEGTIKLLLIKPQSSMR